MVLSDEQRRHVIEDLLMVEVDKANNQKTLPRSQLPEKLVAEVRRGLLMNIAASRAKIEKEFSISETAADEIWGEFPTGCTTLSGTSAPTFARTILTLSPPLTRLPHIGQDRLAGEDHSCMENLLYR